MSFAWQRVWVPESILVGERGRVQHAPSAPVGVLSQRGGSPRQALVIVPETKRTCVAVRRGGEQQEVNDQSEG
jgi:hypothetical protein